VADAIFQTLTVFFAHYGYWAIFFGVMLENAGLPVPGETVLLFAGFLAYQGDIELWRAILTAIVAASLGDSLGYCLGRFAGTAFVEKYVRRFKVLSGQFDRAHGLFLKHGHWAVFVGRFITGLRVFAGPLAGMFRMAYLRFLFFNFSGALIWASTVGCVGFFFGSSWDELVSFVEKFHQVVLIVLGLALLVALIYYLRRRRKGKGPQAS
jgi:LPXTG-motif cell wall-anchored protein